MGKFQTLTDITGIKNSIMAGFDKPSFAQQRRVESLEKGNKDDLEKSHIIDAFSYGDDKLKITKTGKEIKEKLVPQKAAYEAEKVEHKASMEANEKIVGEAPTEDREYDYEHRGIKLDDVPKAYAWRKTEYSGESKEAAFSGQILTNVQSVDKEYADTKEKAQAANKYNSCRHKYLNACAEIKFIEMMERNLNDATSYSLNTKQAAALGF